MVRSVYLSVCLLLSCVIFASGAQTSLAQSAGETIQSIQIEGTQRIEPTTVRSYLGVSPGDVMSERNLDKALKSLFATGLFADVSVQRRGQGQLLVEVKENPIVNQIDFEGNDKIKDEELLAEIQLRPREVFTETKAR